LTIPLSVVQEPFTGPAKETGIPNVHLPTREGLALRERLAAGPVTVRVVGRAETDYSYVLKPYEEGAIPDSLDYPFGHAQLATVEVDYHTPEPTTFVEHSIVWKPDDVVKQELALSDHAAPAFVGPRSRIEYFGPVSDQVLYNRTGYGRRGGLTPEGYRSQIHRATFPELFVQPAQARQEWYVPPLTPGVRTASGAVHARFGPDALQSLGDCTFCRQGGYLFTLFPAVAGGPANRQTSGSVGGATSAEEGFWDFDVRLFRDGAEVSPVPGLPWDLFPMPAAAADYRLTAVGPKTDAAWTFSSAAPVTDTRQPGYRCLMELLFGSTDPCAPSPMVFASYDLAGSLGTDNTVRAPGVHRFRVHAYHSPSPVPMPAVAGLKLWVSYDGGGRWAPARVTARGDGEFEVTVFHPPARARGSDSVSLRVEAWDADGNRLEQTTLDAFGLSEQAR
jgi:hypothetical protein